jgi:hypothetical protein
MEKIYIRDGALVLNIRYPYYIELDRIDTPIKACSWIIHLLEKNWITREILFEMACVLQRHFGYNLHDFAEVGQ